MIKLFSSILFLFSLLEITAQDLFNLKGNIKTENGEKISFCNIIIKNQPTKGVVSAYDGSFNIDVEINDTLLVSYIGYEKAMQIVRNNKFTTIVLKPTAYNLAEIIIKPTKPISPEQVIFEAQKRWYQNHLIFDKNHNNKVKLNINFLVLKDLKNIYSFNGEIDLFLNDSILTDKKNSIYRLQTEQIPSRVLSLPGGTPHELIGYIFFKIPIEKKYKFELGSIEYYNNQPVYQVKFHRKKGGGICEGGGYYLISKNDFSLLYRELVVIDCDGFNIRYEYMTWKYFIVKNYYENSINDKLMLSKVENIVSYDYTKNSIKNEYYYDNHFTIESIEINPKDDKIKRDLQRAKDVFYNYLDNSKP